MKLKFMMNSTKTLDFKVRISLITVAIVPLVVYIILNSSFLTNNFLGLEKLSIQSRVHQVNVILNSKAKDLQRMAKDYAIWDEAYQRVIDKDHSWFQDNYSEYLPDSQEVDLLAVTDKVGELMDGYGISDESLKELLDDITINKVLKGEYDKKLENYPYGLKILGGDLYLIGVCPILEIDYQRSSQGVVILGKKVTTSILKSIEEEFGYKVCVSFNENIISEPESHETIERYSKLLTKYPGVDNIWVEETKIIGGSSLNDISNKETGSYFIIGSRVMFLTTLDHIHKNAVIVLLLSIIIIISLSIMLIKIIKNPIKNLENQISVMIQDSILRHVEVNGFDELASLAISFNRMVDSIRSHKAENQNLKTLSITDSLTSLYNHRYLYEYLHDKIQGGCKHTTVLFCDIDHFKLINDLHGHHKGDFVLKEIGKIIKKTVGENGEVFRYGGEEFVVVLEQYTADQAKILAEKIRSGIGYHDNIQQYCAYTPVSLSIGLATYPDDALSLEVLINKADKAMYFAKQNGRNQCCTYTREVDEFIENNSIEFAKREMLLDSVHALVAAIDAKDTYTEKHSESVVKYAIKLAEKMEVSDQEKYKLSIGGLLHDCGKIGIPDEIIHKTDKLAKDEFDIIKNHTLLGSNIIKYIIKDPEIEACVRYHHERWDGKGYPDGLSGTSIPLFARIICVADSFHAMVSDRPYRKALTHKAALEELVRNKGIQFDPVLVDLFVEAINHDISPNENVNIA